MNPAAIPTTELIAWLRRVAGWAFPHDAILALEELIRRHLRRGTGGAAEQGDAIPPRPITGAPGAIALHGQERIGKTESA